MKRPLQRLLFSLVLLLALATASGCGKNKRPNVKFGTDTIKARSEAAQVQFDRAVTALQEERWDDAVQGFRLVQAEYPSDPVAIVAEMYGARAGLRDLVMLEPSERSLDTGALAALAQLAESREDDRIRFAALVYYAAGLATMGQRTEALVALEKYPSETLSPLVLSPDRAGAFALVGESTLAAGRFESALGSFGNLYESTDDESLQAYARSRAFEAASQLTDDKLVEWTASDMPFGRAVAGWTHVDRRAPKASAQEATALQGLLQDVAMDLTEIGEGARVDALSRSLSNRQPPRRLAIGVAFPLTGSLAPAGRRALDGALTAVEAYQEGIPQTTLLFVDSATADPMETMARWRREGVSAIVGPLDAKRSLAWAEAANQAELPLFAITTDRLGAAAGDWAFRWFSDPETEARAVAWVAYEQQGDARVAVLYPNIGYGRRNAEWFTSALEAAGGSVVLNEEYDRQDTDYSRLAARVAREKPQAIFIADTASKVGEVTAFLAQANVWGIDGSRQADPKARRTQVHYLGTSLWNDPALLLQARSYVEGALIPAWASAGFDSMVSQKFFARYSTVTGSAPNDLSVFAADAVSFVRNTLASGRVGSIAIRDAALEPQAHRGITGQTYFGPGGEPVRTLRFITVSGGEFRPTDREVPVGAPDGS